MLFWNPRSGGGKAVRLHLAAEARARGIHPVEVHPGADLEQLVTDAADAGADALAVAGGDGSQATVARVAADRGLPYACIPAGTRNHLDPDPRKGYLRAISGDLAMTGATWRSGAGQTFAVSSSL